MRISANVDPHRASSKEIPENIKIIGAGFSRPGTNSLREALHLLGYYPFNGYNFLDSNFLPTITEVLKSAMYKNSSSEPLNDKFQNLIKRILLQGFDVTLDLPLSLFFEEQMKMFPDSKIILTVRDKQKWIKSFSQAIYFSQSPSVLLH